VSRITYTKDALNPYDYSFVVYEPATGKQRSKQLV
jgi:hypothetical protein